MRNVISNFHQLIKVVWLGLLLTSGCIRLERISTDTPAPPQAPIAQATSGILVTATPDYGWRDVNYLMEDVCFEAALNSAGQVFKIPDQNALNAFYTQIDRNKVCEDDINPVNYAFNADEMIVGLWSSGTGCNARHEVPIVRRDDAQKREAIQLQFITEGDCPYELLQPFWIALPHSADYDVQIAVQPMQ
jgi:hypothetical protein